MHACVHEYRRDSTFIWYFPVRPHRTYLNARSSLKSCLLHGEKTDLCFKTNHIGGQTLLEVFSDLVFAELDKAALDDLAAVLAKLSKEEAGFHRANRILNKRFVKELLWHHIERKTIQPLLLPFKECAEEMASRIPR